MKVTDLLAEFWGGFTDVEGKLIPAYKSGYAFTKDDKNRPIPAPFPYITYEVVQPNFSSNAPTTVNIWDKRHAPGDFTVVNHILEQVEEKIPTEGLLLPGDLWLKRNSANFIFYMDDPHDQLITRGVVNLMLQNFIL